MSTSTSAARCSGGRVRERGQHRARAARRATAASAGSPGRAARGVAGLHRAVGAVVEVVGQRVGRAGRLAPAEPVEAGVDHDPVQPGGDRRVAAVGVGPAERRDQRVLQGVGRLLAGRRWCAARPPTAGPGAGRTACRRRRRRPRGGRRAGAVVRSAPARGRSRPDGDLGDLALVAAAPPAAAWSARRPGTGSSPACRGAASASVPAPVGAECDRVEAGRRRSARRRPWVRRAGSTEVRAALISYRRPETSVGLPRSSSSPTPDFRPPRSGPP